MASDGGETAPSSPPRDVIADRYRITKRLGRGGMGTVWQATDELLRREVAVKELHLPDEGLSARQIALRRERALREARTAALIRHPHVVVVHDVVEHRGHPWIVMELIDGRSLAYVLAQDGPLPPREAARVGAAVAGALQAAHEREIQHRDVKPANILIEYRTGRVVLTDFGIARVPGGGTISETGGFVGSPEYTAPERMSGKGAGPASDLWSLGALLCAAVHGESPFHRDSIGEIVHAVAIDTLTPPDELGPLLPVALSLLDRDPDSRMGAVEARRLLAAFAETGERPVLEAQKPEQAPWPEPDSELEPEAQQPESLETSGPEEADDEGDPAAAGERDQEGAGQGNGQGDGQGDGEPAPVALPFPARPDIIASPAARPSSHRARGRRRRGGIQVVAVGALVVLAVSAGAAATYLVSQRGSDSDAGAAPATSSPPPTGGFAPPTNGYPPPANSFPPPTGGYPPPFGGNGPPSPPPDDQGPPPGSAGTPPLPPGFHLVTDPAGFSVTLPPAFARDPEPPYTYYWSPDHVVRFGEREQKPDPRGPYDALNDRKRAGSATYAGYRDGVVTSTLEHGQPAALWEFTYDHAGARRTFDLCWTENGRMFDISLSAPVSQVERARSTFDIARGTFRAN
ncbi:Serine/threonine protein kinase [Streptomyces sp. DvalAA-14]|uniref:serine/threonine-protein kinase n=1 Tax=unclassified Streptomyces TaxID=2593676 RepID=UPI00081B1790|nr:MULTISPECIES: serine/threonine-protein kinase [unclassified Streptomyces]MYS19520.1 protein kinase [Streptomyces sp. SID4948]SCD46276.1 Serine/threonine protein kinase [Streptomyces sp. DvalAA-14]